MASMHSRVARIFSLFMVGAAASCLHAATITFDYNAPNVGSTEVSGFGSFTYANGALTSIGLSDLSAFTFELDLLDTTVPVSSTNPAVFDFNKSDLTSFSASASGGVITALSLMTGFEAANNTSNFDENQKDLIVTSLLVNGASNQNDNDITPLISLYDTGTITITPEPSSAWLAGSGALLLAFWRLKRRAPQA
jgi:hypothetical protein